MWFMSYSYTIDFNTATHPGTKVYRVGSTVTKVHPLVRIKEYQDMEDKRRERSPRVGRYTFVLTSYTQLTDDDRRGLEKAGINLAACCTEVDLT